LRFGGLRRDLGFAPRVGGVILLDDLLSSLMDVFASLSNEFPYRFEHARLAGLDRIRDSRHSEWARQSDGAGEANEAAAG
jgi:hypothetical protein